MAEIATFRAVVLDCPSPKELAEFYRSLLGGEVQEFGDWAVLRGGAAIPLGFQQANDYRPPIWPDPDKPQQFHIDLTVEDIDVAEEQVLAIGAAKADFQPDDADNWRVYLDPVGHPFCLCWD